LSPKASHCKGRCDFGPSSSLRTQSVDALGLDQRIRVGRLYLISDFDVDESGVEAPSEIV
jgi:hypothetical protein